MAHIGILDGDARAFRRGGSGILPGRREIMFGAGGAGNTLVSSRNRRSVGPALLGYGPRLGSIRFGAEDESAYTLFLAQQYMQLNPALDTLDKAMAAVANRKRMDPDSWPSDVANWNAQYNPAPVTAQNPSPVEPITYTAPPGPASCPTGSPCAPETTLFPDAATALQMQEALRSASAPDALPSVPPAESPAPSAGPVTDEASGEMAPAPKKGNLLVPLAALAAAYLFLKG